MYNMDTFYIHQAPTLQHAMKTSNKCCQDLIKKESGLLDTKVNMLKYKGTQHLAQIMYGIGNHTKESSPYCEASLSFVQTCATFAIVKLPHLGSCAQPEGGEELARPRKRRRSHCWISTASGFVP